jgi:hypothetical protein
VVFEQQPSGMLGTAAPDGSHRVTLPRVGALQGSDLPVAADDGRYGWAHASFADGSRYVVATTCDLDSPTRQSWVADLVLATGGKGHKLGTVTDAVGDPGSAAAIVSVPVNASAVTSSFQCDSTDTAPDRAIELRVPGHW